MGTETHTGRLVFGDGQVDMEDGTVLAVSGSATPCATALARYEKWGQTQAVTVTGTTGTVNNSPVLFVTTIQWAAPPAALAPSGDAPPAALASSGDAPPAPPKTAPAQKARKKKAARSGSKQ
jgi:hypothetical protein